MNNPKIKAAIIGSGNIGSDLMIKMLRYGQHLEIAAMVGIDPESDGLTRAQRMDVATTHRGVQGLIDLPEFKDIDIVFDATSANAHIKNDALLRQHKPNIRMVDLTPAAIGPYCVPVVNLEQHIDQLNVNMVTCGGQATIPIVAADQAAIEASIEQMVAEVQKYVAGYRLKQKVQFEVIPESAPLNIAGLGKFSGLKTSVFLEVEGAAHYLPAYAGNLDIMTSAALATGEKMAASLQSQRASVEG